MLVGMFSPQTPDEQVDALAACGHAVITLDLARRCGLTDDQVQWRVDIGRWLRRARGVYVVAGAPATWQQQAVVACAAGPPGTVASHLTAAALYGLVTPPPLPHVTVPRTSSGRLRIAKVHHATLLPPDVTEVGRVPCTAPARTLVDCAAVVGLDRLYGIVDTALCRQLTTVDAVHEALRRASPRRVRRGTHAIVAALAVWTPGPLPGSPAEMRTVRRLIEWGLPPPVRQHEVRDGKGFVAYIDLAWPEARVGLEYDGEEAHGPRQRGRDARRQARLEALGWHIERARKGDIRAGESRLRAALTSHLLRLPAHCAGQRNG